MIKGIIFDLDGVVIESERKRFKDLKKVLKKYSYKLNKNDFKKLIGKKTGFFLEERFPEMTKKTRDSIIEERKSILKKTINEIKLIPGILPLLNYLKSKKYRIALVTGASSAEKIIKEKKIRNFFDVLISGKDFKKSKPDPESYLLALKKMKLKPEEAVIIEDSLAGIEAAKNAKCKVFALQTYFSKKELSKAGKQFKNHYDILRYIKSKADF